MASEYVVSVTVRTNVVLNELGANSLLAGVKAMEYGLGDLIGQGEYVYVSTIVEAVPNDGSDDNDLDNDGGEDYDQDN
jgi:hypothetical protein